MPPLKIGSLTQSAARAAQDLERSRYAGLGGAGLRAPMAQKQQKFIEGAVATAARGTQMTTAEIRKAVNRALAAATRDPDPANVSRMFFDKPTARRR